MLSDNPLSRIPLIFDLGIALLMFGLCAGLGVRLLRWLRVPIESPLERGVFALTLGIGAVSHIPFVLFAVGLGKPPVVATITLLLFCLFLPDTFRMMRVALRCVRKSAEDAPAWAGVLFLALLPLLGITLLGALCPPADPDGLHYHLTAPQRYLQEGRFVYMPTFLHVHWPLSMEMLFAVGMAFKTHFAGAIVQYMVGLTLLIATYVLGKRIGGAVVGWLSACLLFPWIRPEMNWAFIDLGVCLYTLMSVFAFYGGYSMVGGRCLVVESAGENESETLGVVWAWWRVAALYAGLAASAKLLGLVTVVVIALAVFGMLRGEIRKRGSKEKGRLPLRWALRLFGIGMLVVAPWLLRSWVLTGAPVYPYFGGIFGAKDWSPEWAQRVSEYFQIYNTFRAQHLSAEAVIRARVITCGVLAALGFACCQWRATRPVRTLVILLFLLAFAQVATSGIYYRFLLPLVPLSLVLGIWLFSNPLHRWEAFRWTAACVVALNLWVPERFWRLPQLPSQIVREIEKVEKTLPVALGSVSRDEYLRQNLLLYPTAAWCNTHLPQSSVIVLGIWDAHAALFDTPTLTTSYFLQNAIRYGSDAETAADLKRLRATHLILQESIASPFESDPLDREAQIRERIEFAALRRMGAQYGTLLYSEQGYTVYALKLP